MNKSNKEDAVSPVIGVMLMLVVTIIIAAIVAAFAGGLATDAERAPSAVLKAEVDSKWTDEYYPTETTYGSVFLTSLSGERINLDKVVVTVYNKNGNTYSYTHPSEAGGVGQYLESGETLNLAYGLFETGDPKVIYLSNGNLVVKSGEYAQVVVVYDDTHVLYDNEVIVV